MHLCQLMVMVISCASAQGVMMEMVATGVQVWIWWVGVLGLRGNGPGLMSAAYVASKQGPPCL